MKFVTDGKRLKSWICTDVDHAAHRGSSQIACDLLMQEIAVVDRGNRGFGRRQRDIVKRRHGMTDGADKVLGTRPYPTRIPASPAHLLIVRRIITFGYRSMQRDVRDARELDVRLVDRNQARGVRRSYSICIQREQVAGRIVRRADDDPSCVIVNRRDDPFRLQLEFGGQRHVDDSAPCIEKSGRYTPKVGSLMIDLVAGFDQQVRQRREDVVQARRRR